MNDWITPRVWHRIYSNTSSSYQTGLRLLWNFQFQCTTHHCRHFPSGKRYISSLLNLAKDINGATLDKNLTLSLFQLPLPMRKYSYQWKIWSVRNKQCVHEIDVFLVSVAKIKPILWQNHNPYLISKKLIVCWWDWCSSYFCCKNRNPYCGKITTHTCENVFSNRWIFRA